MICSAKIDFLYSSTSLQDQVKMLLEHSNWLAHYNKVQYKGNWEVLPLRSPNGNPNMPFAESLNGADFRDTPLLELLPAVKEILNQLKCKITSVRLLNLKAGAQIKPHRDFDLCFEGEVRLHFPVFTNPHVVFKLDNDILPMQAGECWYINANLTHSVSNLGSTDRVHLVVDCHTNDWVKSVFENSDCYVKEENKKKK